ncbi:hypothetical protein QYF61_010090 [Mycteria americana]|uniref:Protein kinase domain-containing protein n=1 Tax=Mycteria americana TaxID=33587 RepID=A0AAN7SHP0_MYCAM|nr:hypothetical protein QYF61_010090 [Mycteria americana]
MESWAVGRINLYELIKKNNFQGFSLSLIRHFTQCVLRCLQVLYQERIIHCDLKPENILLYHKGQGSVKVIDFGSSCYEHQRVYTYVQSRFYRSPEVILGHPYAMAVDMWSLGCIMAELYTGYPLFPGENEVDQLACIMEVLGLPPADFIQAASRKRTFFENIWKDTADKVKSELAERLTPTVPSTGTTENDVENTRKHTIPEKHLETQTEKNDQAEYSGETALPKNSLFFPPIK